MLRPTTETLRLFLHLFGAAAWIGALLTVTAIKVIGRSGPPEPAGPVARGYAWVAWPGLILTVVTGIWGLLAQDGTVSAAYNNTLGVKVLLVVAAAGAAVVYQRAEHRRVVGAAGAVTAYLTLMVLYLGITLTTGG